MNDDIYKKYIEGRDIPEPRISDVDDEELEIHSWKSRKTIGYALLSILQFIESGKERGRIAGWPIPRTPACRRSQTQRAIDLLDANDEVFVKQQNGSIYLYRREQVA